MKYTLRNNVIVDENGVEYTSIKYFTNAQPYKFFWESSRVVSSQTLELHLDSDRKLHNEDAPAEIITATAPGLGTLTVKFWYWHGDLVHQEKTRS